MFSKLRQKSRLRSTVLRVFLWLLAAIVTVVAVQFLASRHYAVLDAQGIIAQQQRSLILIATGLSLVIILPVFWLTFYIVRTYREDSPHRHKKRHPYLPDWDHNRKLETMWWTIPSVIIIGLSIITWQSSHQLDPYRPIKPAAVTIKPVTIQVIAMQWKWLFIYPDQGVASVNYVKLPTGTPVNFRITSDAPMNSFWIPQLGGQVYAMTGMTSQLHLMTDRIGSFRGSSANLSGEGFAGMYFTAESLTPGQFDAWAKQTRENQPAFTMAAYNQLSRPSKAVPISYYNLADSEIFDTVIAKYMSHPDQPSTSTSNQQPSHKGHKP